MRVGIHGDSTIETDTAWISPNGRIGCSVCRREFNPGDRIIGQLKVTMEAYSNVKDMRLSVPAYYPVNRDKAEFLSIFHERCLL